MQTKSSASWLGVVVVCLIWVALAGEALPAVDYPVWAGAAMLGWFGFFLMTVSVIYGVSHMPVHRSAVILLFELIVGAVGSLQFDLVAHRLQDEYRADCLYEPTNIFTARWIRCEDAKMLADFKARNEANLALDGGGYLTYLASSRANLQLAEERWPEVTFAHTREH